jgi:hypothetical protein
MAQGERSVKNGLQRAGDYCTRPCRTALREETASSQIRQPIRGPREGTLLPGNMREPAKRLRGRTGQAGPPLQFLSIWQPVDASGSKPRSCQGPGYTALCCRGSHGPQFLPSFFLCASRGIPVVSPAKLRGRRRAATACVRRVVPFHRGRGVLVFVDGCDLYIGCRALPGAAKTPHILPGGGGT